MKLDSTTVSDLVVRASFPFLLRSRQCKVTHLNKEAKLLFIRINWYWRTTFMMLGTVDAFLLFSGLTEYYHAHIGTALLGALLLLVVVAWESWQRWYLKNPQPLSGIEETRVSLMDIVTYMCIPLAWMSERRQQFAELPEEVRLSFLAVSVVRNVLGFAAVVLGLAASLLVVMKLETSPESNLFLAAATMTGVVAAFLSLSLFFHRRGLSRLMNEERRRFVDEKMRQLQRK